MLAQEREGRPFSTLNRTPNLSDRVVQSILAAITDATLKPGDKLPSERDLGIQFGVSRTVVREALRSLGAKGVVDIRSGSGAVVSVVDARQASEALRLYVRGMGGISGEINYDHISDVRGMIELQTARVAAGVATSEDLAELAAVHRTLDAAGDDIEEASRRDVEFHRTLAAITHNPLYLVMLDSIEPVLLEIRRKIIGLEGAHQLSGVKAHGLILDRVGAHDPVGAEQAMADHLAESRALWNEQRARGAVGAGVANPLEV